MKENEDNPRINHSLSSINNITVFSTYTKNSGENDFNE